MKRLAQKTANYVKNKDLFGDPVKISYEGKASHKTYLGGFVSLAICSSLLSYVGWRLFLFHYRERDEYWTSMTLSDWDVIGSF